MVFWAAINAIRTNLISSVLLKDFFDISKAWTINRANSSDKETTHFHQVTYYLSENVGFLFVLQFA